MESLESVLHFWEKEVYSLHNIAKKIDNLQFSRIKNTLPKKKHIQFNNTYSDEESDYDSEYDISYNEYIEMIKDYNYYFNKPEFYSDSESD